RRREEMYKFVCKPGITGLAQVNGRGLLNWGEILAWDLQYVRTRSVWLDLKNYRGHVEARHYPTRRILIARTEPRNLSTVHVQLYCPSSRLWRADGRGRIRHRVHGIADSPGRPSGRHLRRRGLHQAQRGRART